MVELRTLARPYAKAVFSYAEAAGTLDQWSSMLELLSAVVADPTVDKLLASPEYTTQQQAANASHQQQMEAANQQHDDSTQEAEYWELPAAGPNGSEPSGEDEEDDIFS